jgi:hypothetical protein
MIDVRRMGHVLVCLALAVGTPTAATAQRGQLLSALRGQQQLVILSTTVDMDSGLITIDGLHFGRAGATVTIDGIAVPVAIQTDTRIVAGVPASVLATPGAYTVSVRRGDHGSAAKRSDEIDVTIGSVGPEGPQGEPGSPGETGSTGPQGDPGEGFEWHGVWDSGLAYEERDAVHYNGSAYVATTAVDAGTAPPAAPWELLAEAGAPGATGAQGATGATGPQGPAGPVDNLGNHTATTTLNMAGHVVNNIGDAYNNGSFRLNGVGGGIHWQNFGGGWTMIDGAWLRTHGNKGILATGGIAGSGNTVFGNPFGGSPRMFANYDNFTGGGIAVSDDGGFYDFNDGSIQYRGANGLQIRTQSNSALTINVGNLDGSGFNDKEVVPSANQWGVLGKSGQAWWRVWAYGFENASDERVKKDVRDITKEEAHALLEQLDAVRTVRFRYLDETDVFDPERPEKYREKPRFGVIAQSMPEEMVSSGDQPVLGVDLAQELAFALSTIKALRSELLELQQRVQRLENRK